MPLEVPNKNIKILEMLEYLRLLHDEMVSFKGTKWFTVIWAVGTILCGVGGDAFGWFLQVSSGKDFVLLLVLLIDDFCNTGLRFRFWFVKGVMFKFSSDMLVTSKLISIDIIDIISQTFFPTLLQTDYFNFHSVGSPVM